MASASRPSLVCFFAMAAGKPVSYWTVSSGRCTLDANQCLLSPGYPGKYGHLERCDVSVHMTGKFKISVESFDTESVHDVLTIDGHEYYGSLASSGLIPQNVIPHGDIKWSSDKGLEGNGWKLCPVLLPTLVTTTASPRPLNWSTSNWSVTVGDCHVDLEGCLASPNYPSQYGPNEHCVVAVHPTNRFAIHVEVFATEPEHDRLIVNGVSFAGTNQSLDGLVPSGEITWTSDKGISGPGWKLCPRPIQQGAAVVPPGASEMQTSSSAPTSFILDDQDASWIAWADAKSIRYRFLHRKAELAFAHPCPGSRFISMAVSPGNRRRITATVNFSIAVGSRRRTGPLGQQTLILACHVNGTSRSDFWMVSADMGLSAMKKIGKVTTGGPVTALALHYNSRIYWGDSRGIFFSDIRFSQTWPFKPMEIWRSPSNESMNITGLALDSRGRMIYVADGKNQSIRKISMNHRRRHSDPYLVTGQRNLGGLALDLHGGTMYWSTDGWIRRAHLNGSAMEAIASSTDDIIHIALDINAGYVYWSRSSSTAIARASCLCQRPGCQSDYPMQPCKEPCGAQIVRLNTSDELSTRLLPEVIKLHVSNLSEGHSEFFDCEDVGGKAYGKPNVYFYLRCRNRRLTLSFYNSNLRRRRTDSRRRDPLYVEEACPKKGTVPIAEENTSKGSTADSTPFMVGLIAGSVFLLGLCCYGVWRLRKVKKGISKSIVQVAPQRLGAGTLPSYWNSNDGIHIVPDASRLADVQKMLDETWCARLTRDRPRLSGGCKDVPSGCRVSNVLRIENHPAFEKYADHKATILEKRGDSITKFPVLTKGHLNALDGGVNEMYLFHGTSPEAADRIAKGDFSLDMSGTGGGTMFGRGVYGAECPSKSDEYSKEGKGAFAGQYAMIIFRAVAGKVLTVSSGDQSKRVQRGEFDSVCGDRQAAVGTYREMVFFDEAGVYAEYIVIYTRLYPHQSPGGR